MKTFLLITFLANFTVSARTIPVGTNKQYTDPAAAVRSAQSGDTVLIHPGTYRGTFWIENVAGTAESPIVIKGVHRDSVRLEGGTESFHFTDCAYLVLEDMTVTGQTGNGLNIDDGGTPETPTHHITLRRLTFTDMDATGNNDQLKLSGLDDFMIEFCTFTDGSTGGSGIDMVGCHRGSIRRSTFERMGSNAIQAKGGTQFIRIEHNAFRDAGERAVNLGGSTGLAFFRPIDAPFEAADLSVYANVFEGSTAPIAFVGCVRTDVANNTILSPGRWVLRILQETVDPQRFVPCGQNLFRNNVIIMLPTLSTHVNIGPNTASETFTVTNNLWWMPGDPSRSRPSNPQFPDQNGLYTDPQLGFVSQRNYRPHPNSPVIAAGVMVTGLPMTDLEGKFWGVPPSIGAVEGPEATTVDGGQGTGDESVRGAQCAVSDPRFVRGSVPYTTIHVERAVDVDAYNVLGERVDTWRLEAGEHTTYTPEPMYLVVRPR